MWEVLEIISKKNKISINTKNYINQMCLLEVNIGVCLHLYKDFCNQCMIFELFKPIWSYKYCVCHNSLMKSWFLFKKKIDIILLRILILNKK